MVDYFQVYSDKENSHVGSSFSIGNLGHFLSFFIGKLNLV